MTITEQAALLGVEDISFSKELYSGKRAVDRDELLALGLERIRQLERKGSERITSSESIEKMRLNVMFGCSPFLPLLYFETPPPQSYRIRADHQW